jgi:hypothetical protein
VDDGSELAPRWARILARVLLLFPERIVRWIVGDKVTYQKKRKSK